MAAFFAMSWAFLPGGNVRICFGEAVIFRLRLIL